MGYLRMWSHISPPTAAPLLDYNGAGPPDRTPRMGGKPRRRQIRFADLVEPCKFNAPYETLRDELEAVRDRRKGIAFYSTFKLDQVADFLDDELAPLAHEFGLDVILRSKRIGHHKFVDVYVLHLDQAWRIPANEIMFSGERVQWTDDLEFRSSRILGYTEDQIAEWMRLVQVTPRRWGQRTLFFVAERELLKALKPTGFKCLPPTALGMRVYYDVNEMLVPRKNAERLLPFGGSLCRLMISHEHFVELFGVGSSWGRRKILTAQLRDIARLNGSLKASIELWANGEWTSGAALES